MKERKPKIERVTGEKKKLNLSSLMFSALALLMTVALFVGLIVLQNYLSERITYKNVVAVKNDIPAGTIITEENVGTYFQTKPVNVLDVSRSAVEDTSTLIGQKARIEMITGEIASLCGFENVNAYTDHFVDPVEISVDVANIADADGGKIRSGDLVNLTMMFTREQLGLSSNATVPSSGSRSVNPSLFSDFDEVSSWDDPYGNQEEYAPGSVSAITSASGTTITRYYFETYAQYVMESVYVVKVLDANGAEIDPADKDSSASIMIFVIEKGDEPDINNALMNCENMRVSKSLVKPRAGENALPGDEQNESVSGSDEASNIGTVENKIPGSPKPEEVPELTVTMDENENTEAVPRYGEELEAADTEAESDVPDEEPETETETEAESDGLTELRDQISNEQ